MKKKIFGYIMREINRLTKDEDLRQDLWLYVLEGNDPFSLHIQLAKIQSKKNKESNILIYMEQLHGLKEKF
jgi:hypothetical protein